VLSYEGNTVLRKKKILKAIHMEPGEMQLDFILLPVGYAYNIDWQKAKRGDYIRFFNGGTYPIFSVRLLKVGAAADILARMRYGITIKACIQRWKQNARVEGHKTTAISNTECLWVVYGKEEESEQ